MKQFCMNIDLISQGRENALFLPSNMAAMTSHENALLHNFPYTLVMFSYKPWLSMVRLYQDGDRK